MVAYITWVTASRSQQLMNPVDKFFLLISVQKPAGKQQRCLPYTPFSSSPGVLFDQKKVEGALRPLYNPKSCKTTQVSIPSSQISFAKRNTMKAITKNHSFAFFLISSQLPICTSLSNTEEVIC